MRRFRFPLVTLLAVLALAAAPLACKDDGGSSQYKICVASCEKSNECTGSSSDCQAQCDHLRDVENPCQNAAEQEAAQWDCINGQCGPNGDTFNTCYGNAPQCVF